jgi:RHH-type proline utilization regulon transcriptional repressor/proline dehydrogenase/delta 1-pyrroline-5-carboxylate dehydrogenase
LIERVAGAVRVLVVGQASELDTNVPPVIEREAQERVARYIETGAREGRIVAGGDGEAVPAAGWFCPPTVVTDLPSDSAVLGEEIFGPVLAIERVRDVAAALDVLDGLPFGLTGGLFARDPTLIKTVRGRVPVGNLYINRGITGAMVGRQPFGGNRLSGTGTKAGGPDYLLHFVEPRAVTENTMRHGLVV